MTIVIEDIPYNLEDFLFKNLILTENNAPNCLASEFLTTWISGCKEFKIQTSGSTGEPKSIILKRKWMEASALQTINILGLWNENVLCCLPCTKIGGLMMIVRSLAGGFNLTIHEPKADPLSRIDLDHTFTFISLVPAQLVSIFESKDSIEKLNKFKTVLLGGAPLSNETLDQLNLIIPDVYLTYGMTETCSHIALQKLNNGSWSRFKVNDYVDIKTDDMGLLSINGFQTGNEWVHTKDIVKIHDSKSFEFIGRADFMINSGGYKIFPEVLEQKIKTLFKLKGWEANLAITDIAHEKWGSSVVLVMDKHKTPSEHQIIDYLIVKLLKHELPKQVLILDVIPYFDNGKLNRLRLRELVSAIS